MDRILKKVEVRKFISTALTSILIKISKIAKFGREMLSNEENIALNFVRTEN